MGVASPAGATTSGLAPRAVALRLLSGVLRERRPLSDLLDPATGDDGLARLEPRDRALARMIVLTALRRRGQIDAALKRIYRKGLPARAQALREILRLSAAQILFLDVPAHAVVDLAVRLAEADRRARHYRGLVNAGLRRLCEQAGAILAAQDAPRLNTPRWLWEGWVAAYGEARTRAIAAAHLVEPALDLTVKSDAAGWAERLGGRLLATGSVRLVHRGRVEGIEGYGEGAWWVQDTAASLPARLLGPLDGRAVIDLCAAPGGKTAQLAHAGARVAAVERSPRRARLIGDNLARLGLDGDVVVADARAWQPAAPADAVLLDAPCTATGTLRRHPDAAWLKAPADRDALCALQAELLARAVDMVRPGGTLVYCTCSLEPEEGAAQIARLLAAGAPLARAPITAAEIGALGEAITGEGELRTLPDMLPDPEPRMAGMDGFFAARLRRL